MPQHAPDDQHLGCYLHKNTPKIESSDGAPRTNNTAGFRSRGVATETEESGRAGRDDESSSEDHKEYEHEDEDERGHQPSTDLLIHFLGVHICCDLNDYNQG